MAAVCKKLTNEQADAVKSSWKLVEPDRETHGVNLFKHLFAIAPAAYGIFSFLKGVPVDKIGDSPSLVKHALGVMDMVGAAASQADTIEELGGQLYQLGQRHVVRGVKPEHYPIVGQALLQTLRDGFGDKFTPSLEEAWSALYTIVSCSMQNDPITIEWQ